MTLTVGSLFSGIGGMDLGLERAGMTVKWQSEIDPYCCDILKKHWPEVPNHGDIKKINWSNVEPTDIICGGYPCQPFSQAGQRKGENDPRHLWPWVRNAISVLRPRFVFLENVQGHVSLGGTTVIKEITDIGYDCEWRVISAAGLGAHHRRNRLIIVAYPFSLRQSLQSFGEISSLKESSSNGEKGGITNVANASSVGGLRRRFTFEGFNEEVNRNALRSAQYWQIEPNMGRMADGVPRRVDRLRGLGNAVVPQMAEYVGRLILNTMD